MHSLQVCSYLSGMKGSFIPIQEDATRSQMWNGTGSLFHGETNESFESDQEEGVPQE